METRLATWNAVGTDVSAAKNLDDVLAASGLDYNVRQCKLYTTLSDKRIASNNAITLDWYRANVNDKTGEILGIVSENYQVCNNRDAFDFVNYIDSDVKFVKAGQTYNGLVYIIASLPEMKILGDSYQPYVIFQNGHNGGISLKAAISPLRIVCQNQFSMAFKNAENTISIRHNSSMQDKMAEARRVLSGTAAYMKELTADAESYASMKLDANGVSRFLDDLFPITGEMTNKKVERMMVNRDKFMQAYLADDNSNFQNSVWGLINAGADYYTHENPIRKTKNFEENHFMAVTFDPRMLNRLVQLATARVL